MQRHFLFSSKKNNQPCLSLPSPLLPGRGWVILLFVSLATCRDIFKCLKMHVGVFTVHFYVRPLPNLIAGCIRHLNKHIKLLCASCLSFLFRGEDGIEVHSVRVSAEQPVLLIIRSCSYHSSDSIFIWSVARVASSLASPAITEPLHC